MSIQFTSELIEAESYALMLDLRDEIEDLLLTGYSVDSIANDLNLDFVVTEAASYPDFELYDDPEVKDFLYGMNFPSNFAEILEFDEEIIIAYNF